MNSTYIIAEAGQNHNGSLDMAKNLIDIASIPIIDKAFNKVLEPVNAIKFCKRDLSEELTKEAWNKPYNSPHSFAPTYGEHREKLELSYEQHIELFSYAKSKKLDFIDTLTSVKAVALAEKIALDYIKVASRDLTNIPLLEEIGKTQIPVIISTGMGGIEDIDNALEVLTNYHENITIMHCLSQYPSNYDLLNLRSIQFLKKRYPYRIGYSDHSIGIIAPVVAVALGAEVIEKHITISHELKGSDHRCALEPDGLWRMTRDIRNVEVALGVESKEIIETITETRHKLERSLSCNKKINKGTILKDEDLIMLSPGNGLNWSEKNKILGKKAKFDIDEMTQLKEDFFE